MTLNTGKLRKIEIHSFKNPLVNVIVKFNNEISVIYGENGIGKTSILNILHGVLNGDDFFLMEYNISKVILTFDNEEIVVEKTEPFNYHWSKKNQLSSIYFNISRYSSSSEKNNKIPLTDLYNFFSRYIKNQTELFDDNMVLNDKQAKDLALELSSFLQKKSIIRATESKRYKVFKHNHALVENFDSKDLINILRRSYTEYVEYIKVNLYSSVAQLLKHFGEDQAETCPSINEHDLKKYIYPNENVVFKYLSSILFSNENINESINKDKLITSILAKFIDLIKVSYDEEAKIISLINYYNEFLNENQSSRFSKRLVITENELKIVIGENISHSIDELSSGEMQFLLLLSIILISNRKDFIIIDEPESSLHATWKRRFLPFLAKISSSQIIVASHSSTLATTHNNSSFVNYLCKIEICENEKDY